MGDWKEYELPEIPSSMGQSVATPIWRDCPVPFFSDLPGLPYPGDRIYGKYLSVLEFERVEYADQDDEHAYRIGDVVDKIIVPFTTDGNNYDSDVPGMQEVVRGDSARYFPANLSWIDLVKEAFFRDF